MPARKRVAYFTEWSIYQRAYTPANIPADALDVVNYAFANISDSGQVVVYDSYAATDKAFPGDTWDQPLRGNFNQLIKLKQLHPNLRTMISVGGWTLSGRFSDVALTDASRQTFAQSAAAFAAKYGFDGVDIDWEYPVSGGLSSNVYRPDDRHNYTLLLQALRATLDAQGAKDGKRYLLTIAAPAGTSIYANLELAPVAGVIDWFNIMSYDYHGAWETTTNHHCPLYANPAAPGDPSFNIASTVKGYLAAGVPSTKIVLGVGAYGRSWSGVPATGNGLFQTSAGVPAGTWDSTGVFDYSDIVGRLAAGGGWIRFWDDTAKVPWVYASGTGGAIFVTYDDPQGVALKTDYVVANRLGGVMMWELSSDVRDITSPLSLLRTVNAHLSP
ncbi:MAG: glycoside hydrolase family 18 protein [Proteobacteria bacterium]|nr:glycoside hydrolase family 18 protein [Pseudomonadota bacterium]